MNTKNTDEMTFILFIGVYLWLIFASLKANARSTTMRKTSTPPNDSHNLSFHFWPNSAFKMMPAK
jgi:uncharacterized protein with PQ loop repeat